MVLVSYQQERCSLTSGKACHPEGVYVLLIHCRQLACTGLLQCTVQGFNQ